MAPTQMAPEALAGLTLAASWLSLPAATTVVTPDAAALLTALLNALENPPPRLMLMAALALRPLATMSLTAHEYPSRMMDVLDELPWNTLTATSVACLATPYVLPPMVPATCVPWPLVSAKAPPTAL
jgi:hypothetical protein